MEKYMDSFKESISKRFEKHENYFKNLTDKVKSFEITHREYKKRLSRLEDQGNTDENETIELQQVANLNFSLFFIFFHFSICINFKTILYQVKSKSEKLLEIKFIQEKLETLCSRVDYLENLNSTNNNNSGELQVVTSEQPSDVVNRQEQQVFKF